MGPWTRNNPIQHSNVRFDPLARYKNCDNAVALPLGSLDRPADNSLPAVEKIALGVRPMTFEQWLARPRRDEMTKPDVKAHVVRMVEDLNFSGGIRGRRRVREYVRCQPTRPYGHRTRQDDVNTSRERPDNDPTALFETMIAYSGSCRIEDGDKLIIKVDTAWHPAWIGTEQVRFFKVDSGVLSITTAWQTHPWFRGRMARGVLTAQRI